MSNDNELKGALTEDTATDAFPQASKIHVDFLISFALTPVSW